MKVLNFGSLNMDYVYQVDHMTREGETQKSTLREVFPGGKGLNQSIAMARAGMEVWHAGMVGSDGKALIDLCRENGVRTEYIKTTEGACGHTIIQVDRNGQNCILLYGGCNEQFGKEFVDEVLDGFGKGDWILLQNEIALPDYIMQRAYEKEMVIFLNPSPVNETLLQCNLSRVSFFVMNEIEGHAITGKTEMSDILDRMREIYPSSHTILTLGEDGSCYDNGQVRFFQKAISVHAVDTTAAGDTFTGYFLSGLKNGLSEQECLKQAASASAIAVTKKGAVPSIPWKKELEQENR